MIQQFNIVTQEELFHFPLLKFKPYTDQKEKLDTYLTGLFESFDNDAERIVKFLGDLLVGQAMVETRRDMVEIDLDDHDIKREDVLPIFSSPNHSSLDHLLPKVDKAFSSVFRKK